jgi:hypothetical protein
MKELMKENKIVKMTIWSIIKVDKRNVMKKKVDE